MGHSHRQQLKWFRSLFTISWIGHFCSGHMVALKRCKYKESCQCISHCCIHIVIEKVTYSESGFIKQVHWVMNLISFMIDLVDWFELLGVLSPNMWSILQYMILLTYCTVILLSKGKFDYQRWFLSALWYRIWRLYTISHGQHCIWISLYAWIGPKM